MFGLLCPSNGPDTIMSVSVILNSDLANREFRLVTTKRNIERGQSRPFPYSLSGHRLNNRGHQRVSPVRPESRREIRNVSPRHSKVG